VNNHKIEHERKLDALIDRLAVGGYKVREAARQNSDQRHAVPRWQLKLLIIEAIGVSNRHSVSKWINELLVRHIIDPNPDTSYWNNTSIFMPHDSTYYFINKEKLTRHTLPF